MPKIFDKNIFQMMKLLNHLVLIYRFQDHNIVFGSLVKYICCLLKYGSWKFQLELWNTNHKSLNQTLQIQEVVVPKET